MPSVRKAGGDFFQQGRLLFNASNVLVPSEQLNRAAVVNSKKEVDHAEITRP
jgi:hypothetical protein